MANRLFGHAVGITVLVLALTVNVPYSAAVNPLFVPSWRCSSTNAEYYNYFGNGPVNKTDAFCTRVGGTAPSLADFLRPCLSAFARDLTQGVYRVTEFGLAGGLCYPNRTGVCTSTSNVLYICIPATTIAVNSTIQCPFLTAANGLFEYPTGRLSPSYARLVCDIGYKLTNPTSWWRPCQPDGNWSPTLNPNCTVVTCPATQEIAEGYLQIGNITFSSTSALRCNGSKAVNGGVSSVCQSDGTWSQPKGRCIAIPPLTCSTVPELGDGNLVLTNSTAIGDGAKLVCVSGYTLVGDSYSTCQSNGSWSTPSGTCQTTCPQYETVTNGLLSIMSNTVSSTATTVCNVNNVLVGNGSSTCQPDGTWSTPTGTCQARCRSLPTIASGGFLFSSDNPGSTATVVCNTGYTLTGGAGTSTCTSGSWTSPIGTCQKNCPSTQTITSGLLSISGNTVNSIATTVCSASHVLVGDGKATCQSGGAWSTPAGTCQARCILIPTIFNGDFLYSSDNPGSTATVVCNAGYTLTGGAGTSTCTSGTWTTPAGTCQRLCPQIQAVANGALRISSYSVNAIATTVCYAGYVLVGNGNSVCQAIGNWSLSTGSCQGRCTALRTITNGRFLFNSDNPGSTATAICNTGYTLTGGAGTSTCLTGAWTTPAGSCQRTCPRYQTVTDGLLSITGTTVSSVASTVCNVSYVLVGSGSATCQSDGTWTQPTGTCQERCTSPPTVSNGRFLFGSDNPGSTASVVCNIGYTLTGGTGTSTCTAGKWTTPAGGCQRVCPQIHAVSNGALQISSFSVNAIATTVCYAGYVLVGNGNSVCQAAGTWSLSTGGCQGRCTTLRTIANGRFLFTSDSPGSIATVVCNTGYTLTGGAGTSTCASGAWVTPAGSCQRTCPHYQTVANGLLSITGTTVSSVASTGCNVNYVLVGSGSAACQSDGTWTKPTGTCQARCTSPPTVSNGRFLFGSDNPGSTVTVLCNTGYTLTGGAGTSTCTAGKWTTPAGVCQRVCPQIQAVANGALQISSFSVNAIATTVCYAGYVLVGNGNSVCQAVGTWSPSTGRCQDRCTTLRTIANGRFLFISDNPGSIATVVCNTGYTLTGGAGTSTCTSGTWTIPAGSCQRTCPHYQTVANGLLSITGTTVSSVANTDCNVNYVLVGSGSATCQSDGVWTTPTGTCQARCTSLPIISNGRFLFGSDSPGSTATVLCNTGYTLIGGTGTSTCTVGKWSTPAGGCQLTCPGYSAVNNGLLSITGVAVNSVANAVCNGNFVLVGDGRATCQSSGTWSRPTGACQARCVNLRIVSNGRLLFDSDSPGSTARVVCNGGYKLIGGAGTSTCTFGSWPPPAGTCLASTNGGCPLAQSVANGLLSVSNDAIASTAMSVCNANYALVGDGRSTCQSDLSWSMPTGNCQARCINIPVVSNGSLLFRSDNPGSTATVVCNAGYTLTGGAGTSTCASGTWTLPAGTCQITTVPTTRAAPTTLPPVPASTATPTCTPSLGNGIPPAAQDTGVKLTAGGIVGLVAACLLLGALIAFIISVVRNRPVYVLDHSRGAPSCTNEPIYCAPT